MPTGDDSEQEVMDNSEEWADRNKMEMNAKKTKEMWLSLKEISVNPRPELYSSRERGVRESKGLEVTFGSCSERLKVEYTYRRHYN